MRPHRRSTLCFFVLLLGLLACTSEEAERRDEVSRIAEAHARLMEANRLAEEDFARRNPVPERRDFGPEGTLILHELELGGAPGREGLHVRYTWMNTTGRTVEAALLRLTLRDPATGVEWSEDRVLRLPLALTFSPDSSYTDELRVLTGGMHRHAGWEWDVSVSVLR